MISGDIHDEIARTNDIPVAGQADEMARHLCDMGLDLTEGLGIDVEMIILYGNHPRLSKNPNHKDKWNNLEWVMGRNVQALANGRFKVEVPKPFIYVHEVLGHKIGFTHGDGYKGNSFAGIPFYALNRRREAFQASRKQMGFPPIDYMMMGHYHTFQWQAGKGCDIIINGSIKGPDEYAYDTMYAAEPAQQILITMDEEHGITALEKIDLGHIGRIQNG